MAALFSSILNQNAVAMTRYNAEVRNNKLMRICENKTGVQYRQVRGGKGCQVSKLGSIQNSNLSPRSSSTWWPCTPRTMERDRSTTSFVVLVTRCMHYGRPSGQTLNLRVKEQRKAVTSGDASSYVCNSRARYAQQPSTIIMRTQGGMAYIYKQPQPSTQRETFSLKSTIYITGPQPTRPPRLTTPLLTA